MSETNNHPNPAHHGLSEYQLEIVKYNSAARKLADKGGKPWLHKGKSDIFRVFCKRGALGNMSILNRLSRYNVETFIKKSRRNNFSEVATWIAANVCLATRTFSVSGTQSQIAKDIGVSQPTVSRIIELMLQMDVIGHAFPSQSDPLKSVVGDKQGVPLNNVYVVRDDFGYLAGKTAGDKFVDALNAADEKASTETCTTQKERLATIRSTLWEGTIKRRIAQISEGCYRKTVSKIKDRFLASRIILKRIKKRGEDQFLSEKQIERYINAELKYCGFGG